MFANAGVKIGAYIRSTPYSNGAYYGDDGHSMVLLAYDVNGITYLEGNGDGNGIVQLVTRTWAEFNASQLSGRGRYICHVYQPRDMYYDDWYPTNAVIKETLPSHCTIEATAGTSSMSLPCSTATDASSEYLRDISKGERLTAVALVLNRAGNYWYQIQTNDGSVAYVPSSKMKYVSHNTSDVTISNVNAPNQVTQGKTFSIGGDIKSTYNRLTGVSVWVYSGEDAKTGGTESISTNQYSLLNSSVDFQCEFNKLAVGTYNYAIYANCTSYYATDEKNKSEHTETVCLYSVDFSITSASTTPSNGRRQIQNNYNMTGEDIIAEARKWASVGATYWSHYDPWEESIYWRTGFTLNGQTSFDCSGFVSRVLNDCGFRSPDFTPSYGNCILYQTYGNGYLPISVADYGKYGIDINDAVLRAKNGDYSGLQPGDVIGWTGGSLGSHVIFYAGLNNGTPWMVEFTGSGFLDRAITSAYQASFQYGSRFTSVAGEAECNHSYSYEVTQEPTCTETGLATYTCTQCGDWYSEQLEATDHTIYYYGTQGDCQKKIAHEIYACENCDYSYAYEYEISGHEYHDRWYPPKDALTGEWTSYCRWCGDERGQQLYVDLETVDGVEEYRAVAHSANGFTFNVDDINGYMEGEDITICTTQYAFETSFPYWSVLIFAQKQENGTYRVFDVIQGDGTPAGVFKHTIGGDRIVLIVHSSTSDPTKRDEYPNWMSKVVALAVKPGETLILQEIDLDAEISANGTVTVVHECVREFERIDPTCENAGTEMDYCIVCGYIFYLETIPATGHDYECIDYELPTCVEDGYDLYECTMCGDQYTEWFSATGEHDYYFDDWEPPTCTEDGYDRYVCQDCDDWYDEILPAEGHDFYTDEEEPTCTESGYTMVVCGECDYVESYQEIAPTGHSYEWYDEIEATCVEDGCIWYSCEECGDEYTEILPATGHKHSVTVTTKPTCTESGIQTYTCPVCEDKYVETIPATGHDYQNNVCANCGDVLIVEYGVELHVSDAKAAAGETVTVDIVLDKNVGFTYLKLGLVYDADALELVSVTNGKIVNSLTQGKSYIWSVAEDATATGVLATLTFKVKDGTSAGNYAVTVTCTECCNEREQDVAVGITGGTVTVMDYIYGDCNGDGAVNGKDVTRLLRYLADYNPTTGESEIEVSLGADATGDGEINGKDVTRLLRYLADYDPMTGESGVVLGPTA